MYMRNRDRCYRVDAAEQMRQCKGTDREAESGVSVDHLFGAVLCGVDFRMLWSGI